MNKKLEAKQEGYVSAAKEARDFVYSWIGMICMVMIWGTLGSLVVYGRIMPPLADLVAGAPFTVGRGSHVSQVRQDDIV
jgi:fatty acid desaturase